MLVDEALIIAYLYPISPAWRTIMFASKQAQGLKNSLDCRGIERQPLLSDVSITAGAEVLVLQPQPGRQASF